MARTEGFPPTVLGSRSAGTHSACSGKSVMRRGRDSAVRNGRSRIVSEAARRRRAPRSTPKPVPFATSAEAI